MNHKWNKDNTCKRCGVYRTMKSWKLHMAMVGNKDYYKYGRSWWYGMPHKEDKNTVKSIGFERPDCKR
jgi:hypothetical protein